MPLGFDHLKLKDYKKMLMYSKIFINACNKKLINLKNKKYLSVTIFGNNWWLYFIKLASK